MAESDLATEFRKVANLMALRAVDGKSKSEAAVILSLSGFSTKDIAGLTGTTEGSVRAALSQQRKRAEKE